jgi:putative addiction module antidote
MLELTVRKVGNSLGMILPAEAARELKLSEGDRLFITRSPEGLRLTPYDPSFEKKMEIALKGMRKYRNALRELAK